MTSLDISGNPEIGTDGVHLEVLMNGIIACQSMRVIHLDGCGIGPIGAAAIAHPIQSSRLSTVSLADNSCAHELENGDLGFAGIVAALMDSRHLTSLSLAGTSLGVYFKPLCGAILLSALTTLSLAGIGAMSTSAASLIATVIRDSKSLTDLNISQTHLEPDKVSIIAEAVRLSPIMQSIHLRGSTINWPEDRYQDTSHTAALADMIRYSRSLTSVDCSKCALSDIDCNAILQATGQSLSMQVLILAENRISSAGLKSAPAALSSSRTMTQLLVDDNDSIGDDGVKLLAAGLKQSKTMTTFSATNCKCRLTNKGAKAIAEAIAFSPSLTAVSLANNFISDSGATALATAIEASTSIAFLATSRRTESETKDRRP
jgi:Ran GTPase-activating protein (RanGAP) involved in mRNA processing and transport